MSGQVVRYPTGGCRWHLPQPGRDEQASASRNNLAWHLRHATFSEAFESFFKLQVLSRVALTKRRRSIRNSRNSFKYDTIEEERVPGSSQQSSSPSKSNLSSEDALVDGEAHPPPLTGPHLHSAPNVLSMQAVQTMLGCTRGLDTEQVLCSSGHYSL